MKISCFRELPSPSGIRVLKITDPETDAVRAVLFSHGCHPVIAHISTKMVSADYPGRAATELRKQLGGEALAMFCQGCGADANVETLNGTFDDVDRIGDYVAWCVRQAAERARPIGGGCVTAKAKTVPMPTRIPALDEAQKTLKVNRAEYARVLAQNPSPELEAEFRELYIEWPEDLLNIAKQPDTDQRIRMDVSTLTFGDDFCLVGLEAEVFHRYQDICSELSPCEQTVVFSFVGGSVSYLPTADEFERGGYETAGADYTDIYGYAYRRYGTLTFTPECEATVREAVREMLRVEPRTGSYIEGCGHRPSA